MKKLFVIAAAAVVALAACSKVEPVDTPNVEIGYQVATYLNQTKAGHTGHTSFISELAELGIDSDQYFKSVAYIHAAQSDGTVAAPALFFNAGVGDGKVETINYTAASGSADATWKPAHPYYWPKSPLSSLTFFSWYDFQDSVTPTVTYTTDGGTATLAWSDRTVALLDNVLYADAAYHYKKNDNGSENHQFNGVTEGVPTLFHHALAKVRFTIAQTKDKEADGSTGNYTFWVVRLSDVALSSGTIKNNGKFSLSETSKTTAATQGTWTLPTNNIWAAPTATQTYLTANLGNADGDIFETNVATGVDSLTVAAVYLTGDNFMDDNYFTVMPQAIGDGVTLTFKYTVDTYYGTTTEFAKTNHGTCSLISSETINVNDLGPTVGNFGAPYTDTGIQLNAITGAWDKWQMNHRYVYNIIINPETEMILYDPAVAAWEDEETATQTVPAE